jgi:hypothetical protein
VARVLGREERRGRHAPANLNPITQTTPAPDSQPAPNRARDGARTACNGTPCELIGSSARDILFRASPKGRRRRRPPLTLTATHRRAPKLGPKTQSRPSLRDSASAPDQKKTGKITELTRVQLATTANLSVAFMPFALQFYRNGHTSEAFIIHCIR